MFFRVLILIISLIGCYLSAKKDTNFSSFIFGISGSAFVWALIHVIDYTIDLVNRYYIERSRFLEIKNKNFSRIKRKLKFYEKTSKPLSRDEVSQLLDYLLEDLNDYNYENNIFPLAVEYVDFYLYVKNLNSRYSEEIENDDVKDISNKELYDLLILTETIEKPSQEDIDQYKRSKKREAALERGYLDYNKSTNSFNPQGNINSQFNTHNGLIIYKTFKPDVDFKNLNEDNKNFIKILYNVLFSKDQ